MDQLTLEQHVINLSAGGKLRASGAHATPASQIPQVLAGFAQSGRKSMTIYFHGGLINEATGFAIAENLLPKIQDDFASYPVFFIWETGPFETLEQSLPAIFNTPLFRKLLTKILKHVAPKVGLTPPDEQLELAGPSAEGSEAANLLEAIQREQLSDAQLLRLTLFDAVLPQQAPPEAIELPSAEEQMALQKDLNDDAMAGAVLQSIIDRARQSQAETLEVAEVGAGQATGYLNQALLDELLKQTPPQDETLELAIALPLEIWVFAARIFVAVLKRYHNGSDHGLLATVEEEIYREVYLDRIGKILLWDQMKANAQAAYQANPVGVPATDDFHGGALFLNLLQAFIKEHGPIELNLIGHSAGSIHICHFLECAATILDKQNPIKNVIFWAPAVNFTTFGDCLVKHSPMVQHFHIFTMTDAAERANALVKQAPLVYPHSLLYLVSGLFERTADGPILGLAIHLQGERHKQDLVVIAVREYITKLGDATIVFSPSAGAGFTSHGGALGPNLDKATLQSAAALIRPTQAEIATTLETIIASPPQAAPPLPAVEDPQKRREKIRQLYQAEKAQEKRWLTPLPSAPMLTLESATLEVAGGGSSWHTPVSNQDIDPATLFSASSFGQKGRPNGPSVEVTLDGSKGALHEAAQADELLLDAYWASYGDAATRALVRSQAESSSILEVVIGTDDRAEITNTKDYPWRCICSLLITAADNSMWLGTAWFVSPRLLLTAGHCVYIKERGGWVKQIEVIPGRHGAEQPFGTVVANNLRSVTGWTQNQQREYDYGAILLPSAQPLGGDLGWFGYTINADETLNGLQINISGYPGDKPKGTQWFHANGITVVEPQVITYNTDTAGGQSGAPVWITQGDKRLAVAIHTNGALTGNSATRITQEVFNNLNTWKAQAQ